MIAPFRPLSTRSESCLPGDGGTTGRVCPVQLDQLSAISGSPSLWSKHAQAAKKTESNW
jgi:hypothetical protein